MTNSTLTDDVASSSMTALPTECPTCGEADQLQGRRSGEVIDLTCGSCGATWQRDTTKRCSACGSDNLRYTPKPLWEKGRGEQRTPAGRIDAYACNDCGGTDVVASVGSPR